MVSMKDIARHCGVSVATVSKALNGQKDISEETRAFVNKVADEMGYLANSAARALKTNRTYNLGVLFVDERQSGLKHEFFSAVLDSLKVEAESHGYDITFINRNVGGKLTSYLQHCRYRGVDGVVIASVNFMDSQVQELASSDIPVVTIDHVFDNRIAVLSDNVSGMQELTTFVLEKGHRKIAFIHGENTSVTQKRVTGFHRACENYNIKPENVITREVVYHDTEKCAEITKELLALPERPTCIFFPDDFSAVGGLNAIREAGLKIPEDISVVGYDGISLASILTPKLTTYRQGTEMLGRKAAAKVIELIENPTTTVADSVIVPGMIIEGESLAAPKQD